MIRMFFAGTSIKPREWSYLKDAVPFYKNHKNIIVRKNEKSISYYFPGPLARLPLDQGNYTIEKNFKRGMEILNTEINNSLKENPEKEISIEIAGHSRGAVAAGRVAKEIEINFKNQKNVKVNLTSLDPVPGPGHFGDDVNLELPKSKNNKSAVVYSVTPSIVYLPQKVKNSDVFIIVPWGHESVYGIKAGAALCDTHEQFHYLYNNKRYTLNELPKLENGIYMCFYNYSLNKVTLENLQECIERIYEQAHEPRRIKVLMDVIIEKLDLNLDQMLKVNKKYRNEFEKSLIKIEKSLFLKFAFNYALELFKTNSNFSYMINKDGIYESILEAKNAITGIKVNPEKALQILNETSSKNKISEYSKLLLNTLKSKIINRYNLDK